FEQPLRPGHREQGIEEEQLCLPGDEPGTELAEDGMMEAGIRQVEPQDIFPINAAADRIRGLAIGEAFGKLEDRDQCQTRRGFSGLAACGEERRELCVVVEWAKVVSYLHVEVPTRERGTGHPLGVFRNRIGGVGVQGHAVYSFPRDRSISGKRSYRKRRAPVVQKSSYAFHNEFATSISVPHRPTARALHRWSIESPDT